VALETNLLLSMEEVNALQHGIMVWLLLLWRLRYWWAGYLVTLTVVLANNRACAAVRAAVQGFLNATFLERRRWHPYAKWRSEAFFVSLLTIALAGGTAGWGPCWYWTAVAMALGQLGFDYKALRTCDAGKGDEQTAAMSLRQGLLWLQKVLLLLLAFPAWSTLIPVLAYYFPAAGFLGLSALYLGVGLAIRLVWLLLHDHALARLAPHAKASLDAWWHDGRDGLNRALVVAVMAVLLVPYTFYRSWDWTPNWKGTGARLLSVLVVLNVVSVDDLQRAWTGVKAGAGNVLGRKATGTATPPEGKGEEEGGDDDDEREGEGAAAETEGGKGSGGEETSSNKPKSD
jgi:hypothetical protein